VLVEGYAASILLRMNQQLKTGFPDWMMELLILNDLSSTNKNIIFLRLIQYNHDIIDMFKCNHEIPLQKN
jgi:hypothetical protein